MSAPETRIHTRTLTSASITFTGSDNVINVSVLVISGTVTANGSYPLHGDNSSAVTLPVGTPLEFGANQSGGVITGFTIDATSGSCIIVCKM